MQTCTIAIFMSYEKSVASENDAPNKFGNGDSKFRVVRADGM